MGFITGIFTWPLAPVRSVVWLASRLEDYAERERRDPERIRRELHECENAFAAGEISERERAAIEESLIALLMPDGPHHDAR
jgi:gas vesicle protein GvpG